jgi:hypothetical protein
MHRGCDRPPAGGLRQLLTVGQGPDADGNIVAGTSISRDAGRTWRPVSETGYHTIDCPGRGPAGPPGRPAQSAGCHTADPAGDLRVPRRRGTFVLSGSVELAEGLVAMVDVSPRWVARLVPSPGTEVTALLSVALGLDVWERHGDELVVAASDNQLAEIERRRLATVERIGTAEELMQGPPSTTDHEE